MVKDEKTHLIIELTHILSFEACIFGRQPMLSWGHQGL
jgi:hypothetical protein